MPFYNVAAEVNNMIVNTADKFEVMMPWWR